MSKKLLIVVGEDGQWKVAVSPGEPPSYADQTDTEKTVLGGSWWTQEDARAARRILLKHWKE